MKRISFVLTALLLASGPALAQTYVEPVYVEPQPVYQFETIQVRPVTGDAISFQCGNLQSPRAIDVENLLQVKDRNRTQELTNKLVSAVGEACRAGIPVIVVERSKSGHSVIWYPEGEYEAAVTSSDTDRD